MLILIAVERSIVNPEAVSQFVSNGRRPSLRGEKLNEFQKSNIFIGLVLHSGKSLFHSFRAQTASHLLSDHQFVELIELLALSELA